MQIVGRGCVVCGERLRSERGAVGCERCELAVHDACVRGDAAGYREAAGGGRKRKARTLCPECGDDLRAAKRARDRERDAIVAAAEERRRAMQPPRDAGAPRRGMSPQIAILLIGLGLALRLLAVLMSER